MPTVNIKGLPQKYSCCQWHKDDEELKKMLNINGTKIADGYGCTAIGNTKFLYERKSHRGIQKAISQLQETAEKLIETKNKIDEIFILADCIGHHEKSIYERRKLKGMSSNERYLYDKSVRKFVEIPCNGQSFKIILYYNNEVN